MRKLLFLATVLTFLLLTAMQCQNDILVIAQRMNIQVNPDPVPIEHGKASFEVATTLPAVKLLKRVDSLVFEMSYESNGSLITIGTTTMLIPANWKATTNLSNNATFELTDFSVPDSTLLYFHMTMFKNAKQKSTERLPVGHFVNKGE